MNCIAVDDEPLALKLLQDNISKVPFLKLNPACNKFVISTDYFYMREKRYIFAYNHQ